VVITTTQTFFGADLREPFSLSYDPLSVTSFKSPPDKVTGYKETKKLVSGRALDFLRERLGKSYWTKQLAPIVLDSIYSTVVASASGHLSLKGPSSILDKTANRLVASGKKELASVSHQHLPDLPVVGNLAEDLTKSQNLTFNGGRVSYRMKMRKRLAPEFKVGQFSVSGGTEAYLEGTSLSRKSVASVGYKGLDSSYRVQLYGRNLRCDVSWSPIDLRLDWNPQVIKFVLNLDLGSWL
jgi:hypothetical protein